MRSIPDYAKDTTRQKAHNLERWEKKGAMMVRAGMKMVVGIGFEPMKA
jgi:hypothetical protein